MKPLIVVENPKRWSLDLPGARTISARDYLMDEAYASMRHVGVYNMCRSYGYQTVGYYVSLLAAARGHRPIPSVATLQDFRLGSLIRSTGEEHEAVIRKSLAHLKGREFQLSIYFGRNPVARYDRLCQLLFDLFPAPSLRARFVNHGNEWTLQRIRPVATSEIPDWHRSFLKKRARQFFSTRFRRRRERTDQRYDLAIFVNSEEKFPPSDPKALRKFMKAARTLGIEASIMEPEEAVRIAEFDALFIRETTYVNHRTYRLARRAETNGLVVLDAPDSIIRCTNKVYQAEIFARHGIPSPATLVVSEAETAPVIRDVGLPCVVKQPDSAFSQGVLKAETEDELRKVLAAGLEESELVVVQEFVPSSFDWRIGVLDGKVIYACRYHMARGHWQVIAADRRGSPRYGKVEAVSLRSVPKKAMAIARDSARLIGDGLYGIDIKQIGSRFIVMEINDNPNIDAGCEDAIVGDELYTTIMKYFRTRLDKRGRS